MAALTTEQQYQYLRTCAIGTGFIVDEAKSPKAEFSRLAVHYLGWAFTSKASTSKEWRTHWKACFGEEYPWNGRGKIPEYVLRTSNR